MELIQARDALALVGAALVFQNGDGGGVQLTMHPEDWRVIKDAIDALVGDVNEYLAERPLGVQVREAGE